jgi:tetratricopeptide (TPR) repeat protein
MSEIGFNDNLEVSGRKFHFQTSTNSNKGKIRCEVYEDGRVLSATMVDFERRKGDRRDTVEDRLKTIVESMHNEMINEIDVLFKISEKVMQIRHCSSHNKIGIMFLQNNLAEDAIRHFQMAIEINPHNLEGYNNLGQAYIHTTNYQKAIEVIRQGMLKGEHFTDMLNNYGFALMMDNQYEAALREFKKAIKQNKSYLEAHYNIASLYFRSTLNSHDDHFLPPPSIRIQRAMEHLQQMKEKNIKVFDILYDKVLKLVNIEKIDQIIHLLEENRKKIFLKDVSNLISTNFYLKFMYGGKGLDMDTIKRYEYRLKAAIESNAEYADLWNNLGVVHLIQCRNLFLQALNEFNKALEINPDFDKAVKNKKLVENDGKEFLILLRAILK